MDKLVDIFCDVDDFCRVFIPEWEIQQLADSSRNCQRSSRMTTSEITTIIICFYISHYRDFKNYYLGYISRFSKGFYPDLFSYIRFLEVMHKVLVPFLATLQH